MQDPSDRFSRSPLTKDNLRAYGQLKKEDYRLAQKNLRQKKYIMFPVSVLICPDLRIFKLTE